MRPLLVAALVAIATTVAAADVILHDDFDDGFAGWTSSGDVDRADLTALVPDAVRLRQGATIERTVSTVGYTGVQISAFLAASLLEGGDACLFEVSTDGGSGWTILLHVTDGDDDQVFRWIESTVTGADDNPQLVLRFRNAGDALSDHCFGEDVTVEGIPPTGEGDCTAHVGGGYAGYVDDYDPLGGAGDVPRTELTAAVLLNGPPPPLPVAGASFAVPAEAAAPLHQIEGRISLVGEASSGAFTEIVDTFNYTGNGDDPRKHLPPFAFDFVQSGSHLIPVERGIQRGPHPYWEYVLEPGRVWSETDDGGMSRAALPFVVQQKNANCVHNGLATFLI